MTKSKTFWRMIIVIAIIIKFLFLSPFLFSGALFQDDSIFVSVYSFGLKGGSPITQDFYYTLIYVLSQFGLIAPKLLLVLLPLLIALVYFEILASFTQRYNLAALLSIILAVYPVSSEQSYFLTGAHPTAGLFIILLFALLFTKMIISDERITAKKLLIFGLVGTIILFVAFRSSPTAIVSSLLMLVAASLLIIKDRILHGPSRWHWGLLPIAVAPIICVLPLYAEYHYNSLEGWTNYDFEQVFGNLRKALEYIFIEPFNSATLELVTPLIALVLAVIAFTILVMGWLVRRNSIKEEYPLAVKNNLNLAVYSLTVLLVFSGAITFGAGAVSVNYLPRYVVPPFALIGLAGSVWLCVLIKPSPKDSGEGLSNKIFLVCLGAITATVTLLSGTKAANEINPHVETYNLLSSTLNSRNWQDNDQLLVLLPDGYRIGTAGFNHWSTWYLRSIIGNSKIIGLVGQQAHVPYLKANNLYVGEYRDHGDQFWKIENGKSRRLSMVGLEKDRKTYTFIPDGEGGLVAGNLILQGQNFTKRVSEGESFHSGEFTRPLSLCETSDQFNLRVPLNEFIDDSLTDVLNEDQTKNNQLISESFVATGENIKNVTLPSQFAQNFDIKISIIGKSFSNATTGREFSDTYPPMPLLSPALAIYVLGDIYQLNLRNHDKKPINISVTSSDPQFEIGLKSCEAGSDKSVLLIDGQEKELLTGVKVSGNWKLGQGYLERNWTGEIKTFEASTLD